MGRRFELLVFDWDGTLMDSAAVITASLQAACSDLDLPVPSDEDARYIIGLGLNDALAHVLPSLAPADFPRVVERYRHHFQAGNGRIDLFPGTREAIAELHEAGFVLAVATGKSRRGLDRELAATGLNTYFHATRCGDEGFTKPHPGMLQYLIDSLGADRARTLMIGDTVHDMQMACNAGVACLGVAYGAHARDQLLAFNPIGLIDAIGELHQWLHINA